MAMSSKSANSSISFALPSLIYRHCSSSSRYIAICLRLPPHFLSKRSLQLCKLQQNVPDSLSPSELHRTNTDKAVIACTLPSLARYQYMRGRQLSNFGIGACLPFRIFTRFNCLHKSCPMEGAVLLASAFILLSFTMGLKPLYSRDMFW